MTAARIKKYSKIILGVSVLLFLLFAGFCVFFDEAVLVRKGSIFHVNTKHNVVAMTFDDGPSPEWTPQILDQLKALDVKATFFMIGKHVEEYPDLARRVVDEGHEVGNHSYDHHGIFFYTQGQLHQEIAQTEDVIRSVTGATTKYFRPPKAWITDDEKQWLKNEGYQVILWTLNSKDWVTFDDKYIVKYLVKRIKPGDIILFHDSGGVFGIEHGDRHETVKTMPRLVEALRKKGYRFVTISELIADSGK